MFNRNTSKFQIKDSDICCATCPFWDPTLANTEDVGLCLYSPPTVCMGDGGLQDTRFPRIKTNWRCGAHPAWILNDDQNESQTE